MLCLREILDHLTGKLKYELEMVVTSASYREISSRWLYSFRPGPEWVTTINQFELSRFSDVFIQTKIFTEIGTPNIKSICRVQPFLVKIGKFGVPHFPEFAMGYFLNRNFAFLLNSSWLIDPWSCFLVTWIIRKIIDIVLHCQSGPLKTICSYGLKEERLPLIDRKAVLSNPSSAKRQLLREIVWKLFCGLLGFVFLLFFLLVLVVY